MSSSRILRLEFHLELYFFESQVSELTGASCIMAATSAPFTDGDTEAPETETLCGFGLNVPLIGLGQPSDSDS